MAQKLILIAHAAGDVPKKMIVLTSSSATMCYSVLLASAPTAMVKISIECRSCSVETVPTVLHFSNFDWHIPQHVFIQARPASSLVGSKLIEAGTTRTRIEHVMQSADDNFNERIPWLEIKYLPTACQSILTFGVSGAGQLGKLADDEGASKCYSQISLPIDTNRSLQLMMRLADSHKATKSSSTKLRSDKTACLAALMRHQPEEVAESEPGSYMEDVSCFLPPTNQHRLAAENTPQDAYDLLEDMSSDSDVAEDGLQFARYAEDRASAHERVISSAETRALTAVAVATGDSHSLVLSATGHVFCCGANDYGQLGVGDKHDRPTMTPIYVTEEGDDKSHAPATPGTFELFPSRLLVVAIACGSCHTVAITSEGALYAWGSNKFGQLGVGRRLSDVTRPTKVLIPSATSKDEDMIVSRVACGGTHTLCAASGMQTHATLFAWGNGRTGALGLSSALLSLGDTDEQNSRKVVWTPTTVEGMPGGVLDLSCGTLHSACLDHKGRLLTCGADESFQLGRSRGDRNIFGVVRLNNCDDNDLLCARATQVACGGSHTLLLLSSGVVLACGDNACGQLGLGPGNDSKRRVLTKIEALEGVVVTRIEAGSTVSAALTKCGRVYMWGQRSCGQLGDAGAPWPSLHSTNLLCAAPSSKNSIDNVIFPSIALTLSVCRTRSIALGRSHAIALTDVRRADGIAAQRNVFTFLVDFKAHIRLAKALRCGTRKKDAWRNSPANRRWIRTYKLYKVLRSLRREQLTSAYVHARASATIRQAELKRILKPTTSATPSQNAAQHQNLFVPTWLDRVAVELLLQTRLSRAIYRTARRSGVDRASCNNQRSLVGKSETIRLHAGELLRYLDINRCVVLRATSTLHRAAIDLALLGIIEHRLREHHADSRHSVQNYGLAGSRHGLRASVEATPGMQSFVMSPTPPTRKRLNPPPIPRFRKPLQLVEQNYDGRSFQITRCESFAPAPTDVDATIEDALADAGHRLDKLLSAEEDPLRVSEQNDVSQAHETRPVERPSITTTMLPLQSRPELPRILEAAAPILWRNFGRDTRLAIPEEVKAKRAAVLAKKKRARALETKERKRADLERTRRRQFDKWLRLAQHSTAASLDGHKPKSRPHSAMRTLVAKQAFGTSRPVSAKPSVNSQSVNGVLVAARAVPAAGLVSAKPSANPPGALRQPGGRHHLLCFATGCKLPLPSSTSAFQYLQR